VWGMQDACRGKEIYTKFLSGSLKGSDHLKDRRIILERLLQKQGGKVWTGFIWLRIAISEYGNEPSDCMEGEGGDFLTK